MNAKSRAPVTMHLPAALATTSTALLVFALLALPACDRSRPQVLLTRGTPEATPTSARQLPVSATPDAASATPSPTATRAIPATAISRPSSTPAPLEPTRTATIAPTPSPTPLPTVTPTSTPRPAATATPQVRIHVVRAGETLAIIARKYATTATAIARYNGLSNPNRIYVGQRLIIP